MKCYKNILSAVGDTPLIALSRLFSQYDFTLFGKLETYNPTGSSKDRPASLMVQHGLNTGEIKPNSVIIESSSGNTGIALAQICTAHRLRFICVVDPRTTQENLSVMQAYGAEIEMVTEPDPETGELLVARINRVKQLLKEIPNSVWICQYSNPQNPLAHHHTMAEIVSGLEQAPDYLFVATSTCGTIMGCAQYIKEYELPTKVIAVDAEGSALFNSEPKPRLIPGLGAGMIPEILNRDLVDRYIHVSSLDCVIGCRSLVRQEAILLGGSSGAVIMALDKIKDEIPSGSVCVVILPDRGARYLSTIYSDTWVKEHFGDISNLIKDGSEGS